MYNMIKKKYFIAFILVNYYSVSKYTTIKKILSIFIRSLLLGFLKKIYIMSNIFLQNWFVICDVAHFVKKIKNRSYILIYGF